MITKNEDASNDRCDAYCFNTLKNLLPTIEETKFKLNNYEDLIQSKNEQILELKKKLADLERHNVKIKQNRICSNIEESGVSLFEAQINKTTDDFNLQDLNYNTLNWLSNASQIEDDLFEDYGNDPIEAFKDSTLNKTDDLQIQDLPLNCLKYAESTYIYEIWVPNVGNHMVLCDEFGWIVILNRFNGSENFYRKWYEYRSGFGYLEDEFFIGLEVLHQMTSSQGYDIRIELTSFDDYVYHADYSNFIIGSEQEKYSLKSIGGHHGNLENAFESNIGQKFTTFDSDNDKWVEGNCAVHYSSAGWFDKVATMNLFGKYLHSEVMDEHGIWWKDNKTWKAVKIAMRPEKKERN
ncbi:microfibril-associated glycoprotein 4-like [Drosophila sulfurigaster albostrigata]|uniref:microfibril-associated glycoprotein 4-like n=1 Tax=Drosophila sulfurigaster albostrigata TaxID=89887 RepID=UPI002D21ABB3|nr:microfibril-associated glycoprotein 4-like [Drosophila sulfurigaster albostrigata]